MKNSKKILICLFAVLLLVTSCGKVPKLENGKEAVVTLKDGEDISIDELYSEMKDQYALSVLLDMVDRQLLEKIYPESDEEKKYIQNQEDQFKYYYEAYYSTQYNSYEEFLYGTNGIKNSDEFKKIVSLSYKRGLALDDYIKDKVITEKEIKKYYDDNIYGEMRASHILIKANYEDDATDEEITKAKEEAKKKAEDLIKKLNEADKDKVKDLFAELAKENSDDSTASNGGDLDWFDTGDMVAAFEDATRKLDVDKYTKEPVETEYGYHIILKTGQKDKPSLEDSREKVIDALVDEKKEEDSAKEQPVLQTKALVALRDEYGIEFQDTELKKQYKTYVQDKTK